MSHSKFHLDSLLMAVTPLMGHYEKGDASRGHLKDSNQTKLIYIKIQRKKGRNRGQREARKRLGRKRKKKFQTNMQQYSSGKEPQYIFLSFKMTIENQALWRYTPSHLFHFQHFFYIDYLCMVFSSHKDLNIIVIVFLKICCFCYLIYLQESLLLPQMALVLNDQSPNYSCIIIHYVVI